ncbi:MAG: hypothetical protein JST68_00450 [Bacteroidetes bacterium]|nr:hypothetical protein [Bacteroidota bacterium]
MESKSPLYVSALELLAHSTELFALKDDKKLKFIVLHLANAVELILKDGIVLKGESIYKKGRSETLNTWECFEKLNDLKVQVPERPILELLIDDRNGIQHRYGFPNTETVYYYFTNVVQFIKRFLNDEYGVSLQEEMALYLTEEQLGVLGLSKNEISALEQLRKVSGDLAIVKAYADIESLYRDIIRKGYNTSSAHLIYPRTSFMGRFIELLISNGYIKEVSVDDFKNFTDIRNKIAHGVFEYNGPDAKELLNAAYSTAVEIIQGMEKAVSDGFFDTFNWDDFF